MSTRLEDIGWAVLLIAIGTIWLVPDKLISQGSWLIAVGLIVLGLNAIRYFNGTRMRGFSLVIGIVALIIGLGEFSGLKLPLFPIALIVIGVGMLLKPFFSPNSPRRNRTSMQLRPCSWLDSAIECIIFRGSFREGRSSESPLPEPL